MKITSKRPVRLRKVDDELLEQDFDIYSDEFDDEEAFDRGMKANEVAFLRGFRRFN